MKYIIARLKHHYGTRGVKGVLPALWRGVIFYGISIPYHALGHVIAMRFRKPKHPHFSFQGKTYDYFYHPYNFTWNNERIIEVPIVEEMIRAAGAKGKSVLEVGNVISHYYPSTHDVLDKYEEGDGIINEDVLTFRSEKRYDLIVSISTMEHVGWDLQEKPEPYKIHESLLNLKKALAAGGEMIITMPLGYNSEMDLRLFSGELPFDSESFLRRTNRLNRWEEISKEAARGSRYGKPFHAANTVVLGIIRNK